MAARGTYEEQTPRWRGETQPLLPPGRGDVSAPPPNVIAAAPFSGAQWQTDTKLCGCVQPAALASAWVAANLAIVLGLWLGSFRFRLSVLLSDVEAGGWRDYRLRHGLADLALLTLLETLLVGASFCSGKSRYHTWVATALLVGAVLCIVKFIVVLSVPGLDDGQGSELKLTLALLAIGASTVAFVAAAVALLLAVQVEPGLAALLQSRGESPVLLYRYISPWSHWRRELWLLLSSFGIIFALMSWLQDTDMLDNTFLCPHADNDGCDARRPWTKFMSACFLGLVRHLSILDASQSHRHHY